MKTPKPTAQQIATAQRAEIHVGLSDDQLRVLAQHAVPQQDVKTHPATKGRAS